MSYSMRSIKKWNGVNCMLHMKGFRDVGICFTSSKHEGCYPITRPPVATFLLNVCVKAYLCTCTYMLCIVLGINTEW